MIARPKKLNRPGAIANLDEPQVNTKQTPGLPPSQTGDFDHAKSKG